MAFRPALREIEIKLRIRDVPEMIARLRWLGAHCAGRVFEQNTLYDTPDSDFRRSGRLLRLRVETPARSRAVPGGVRSAVVTSKRPAPASARSRYKEKLERELAVRFPQKWPALLRSIGFQPGFSYEKYRTSFRLPGLHLDLDETPVGAFLELEGDPRAIDRNARALGFSPRDYIRGTYWDVFQAECRRRGRFPKNMRFHA
ncbi:MAG TPA: class IV adenylate cyclase [Candidatus Acidoferrum sp.]|jgi:adenylate cyclase class 2|nr:class IV adenylate cyclase [Candidatus Acidoferrum sp.]